MFREQRAGDNAPAKKPDRADGKRAGSSRGVLRETFKIASAKLY